MDFIFGLYGVGETKNLCGSSSRRRLQAGQRVAEEDRLIPHSSFGAKKFCRAGPYSRRHE
jgi:hypothetical protein